MDNSIVPKNGYFLRITLSKIITTYARCIDISFQDVLLESTIFLDSRNNVTLFLCREVAVILSSHMKLYLLLITAAADESG